MPYEQALPEHIQVMEALRDRDVDRARDALRHHLENACNRAYVHWNGATEHHTNGAAPLS